jgi:hypothetical protein
MALSSAIPETISYRGVKYAIPIGVLTAVEVTASNLSLLTISVSFHTMVKSSVPLFVLVFSVMTGLQKAKYWQAVTVVVCAFLFGSHDHRLKESLLRLRFFR